MSLKIGFKPVFFGFFACVLLASIFGAVLYGLTELYPLLFRVSNPYIYIVSQMISVTIVAAGAYVTSRMAGETAYQNVMCYGVLVFVFGIVQQIYDGGSIDIYEHGMLFVVSVAGLYLGYSFYKDAPQNTTQTLGVDQ